MIVPCQKLVGLFCVTSGEQGENLGCDEKPITDIFIFVHELKEDTSTIYKHFVVECNTDEVPHSPTADGSLTSNLASLIEELQNLTSVDGDQERPSKTCLCAFGPYHLRMVLHPVCLREKIILPDIFDKYIDIKTLVQKFYGSHVPTATIQDVLKHLQISTDTSKEYGIRNCKDTLSLVTKIINDGYTFTEPECITKNYADESWKGEAIDDDCVVKARGLPWQSAEGDVANFFKGLNIAKGGVALCMTAQGRKNGEAMVRFETKEHRSLALRRHKHHLGCRYIEVFRSTGKEFIQCIASSSKEAKTLLIQQFDYFDPIIIRMRGLPYTCKASQVIDFFRAEPTSCEVLDGEGGVLFIYQSEGRNTGDAFVLLANDEEAAKALTKHKQCIGTRYIELFKSTVAEVQQVLNKSFDPRSPSLANSNPSLTSYFGTSNPLQSQKQQVQLHSMRHLIYPPQNVSITKDCIRLVGLPPETSIHDLVVFLSDHVKDIKHKGVHLIYNPEGLSTGEAFIEMVGDKQAESLRESRNGRMILVVGLRHVIHAHRCSVNEMALLLSGGQEAQPMQYLTPIYPSCPTPDHFSFPPGVKMHNNPMVRPVLPVAPLPPCHYSYNPYPIVTILPANNVSPTLPASPMNNHDIIYISNAFNEKVKI